MSWYAILKLLLVHTISFACNTQVHENTTQNFNNGIYICVATV